MRERSARKQAEKILEEKSAELYELNQKLKSLNNSLEEQISERTKEIQLLAKFPDENPNPVLRASYAGVIIYCNSASKELMRNLNCTLYDKCSSELGQIISETAFLGVIYEKILKIGAKYFSFTLCPVGEAGYINIYGKDVTETKINQFEFQRTHSRLIALIKNIQEGILFEDENRRVVLANSGFCELLGISNSHEELVGISFSEISKFFTNILTKPQVFENTSAQIVNEKQATFGEELHLKNGKIIEQDYIPVFSNDRFLGHLWKYKDITFKKQAEQRLKENEEKYKNIIENMELGLVEVDGNFTITDIHNWFSKMTGFMKEELIGRELSKLITDQKSRDTLEIEKKNRLEGKSGLYEIQIIKKDGKPAWFLVSSTPVFGINKNVLGAVCIHMDISNQKRLEQSLENARFKAETAANSKQEFLANMSHEIRTPMNAIVGMTDLLEETNVNEKQSSYIEAIKASADNLLVIINDILDFSKIEAGKINLEFIDFNLKKVIDLIINSLQEKAKNKNIELLWDHDESISEFLVGDPVRLSQILTNLINNAIKFTEEGSVKLICRLVSDNNNHNVINFKVLDTGIGIEQSKLKTIFDKFTQEDSSTTRRYGGTGLGLSISKQLVELFGGYLEIESEKGFGTILSFKLTLRKGKAGNDAKVNTTLQYEESKKTLKGKKILLVEDHEINQFLAISILKDWGVEVDLAENGQIAINKVVAKDYDLILMDMQMPVMDGIEATREIRNTLKSSIPIIALTANAIKGDDIKCNEAGMNDYVSKPFDKKILFNKIVSSLEPGDRESSKISNVPYNLSGIDSLTAGDETFKQRIIEMFIDQAPDSLTQIKQSLLTSNLPELKSAAHKLKPSIDLFGIQPLQQNIRQIETFAQDQQNIEHLPLLVDELEQNLEKVIIYLKSEIHA